MKYTLLIFALALTACADHYRPIVHMENVNHREYDLDLAQCREYAKQINPAGEAVASAIAGALAGALIGAAVGAVTGDTNYGTKLGGATGAATGVTGGAANAMAAQVQVINTCLRGRGYKVLRN